MAVARAREPFGILEEVALAEALNPEQWAMEQVGRAAIIRDGK